MSTVDSNDLIERLTLGVATTLEKRPGVCDVSLSNHPPAERHKIIAWEQRNTCMLPDDLKNFYLTTNGLLLTWKAFIEDSKFPVGRMEINSIEDLTKISVAGSTASITNKISLADVDYVSDSDSENEADVHKPPHFDGRSRIFEMDPCNGFGKVCFVYSKATPGLPAQGAEVWFLDRSLNWSFLASDFETYYRLMLMHLGLPQWQYAFTPVGLSPKAKNPPSRDDLCEVSKDTTTQRSVQGHNNAASVEVLHNLLSQTLKVDFGKIFKGKSDKAPKSKQPASNTANAIKKKQAVGPARPPLKAMAGPPLGRSTKPWN